VVRITTQLYTLRNEISADYAAALKKHSEVGPGYVELGGQTKEEAIAWKKILDDCGTKVSGAHYGLPFFDDADNLFECMNIFDCKNIIVPWVQHDTFATIESIKQFADGLNKAGEVATAAGFNFLYHNHDFEFVIVDGENGMEHLIAHTDPRYLKLEVDVAWVKLGGVDELEFLNKHAARVGLIHGKDFDPANNPRWTVAGQGTVNLDGALKFAVDHKVEFVAIELDDSPIAPMDAVAQSYEFYKSKGFN
jgi:sugar phosphate isomerase/epimerase